MKKLVSLGEILMRLSCENKLRFSQATNFEIVYGGSEANVAISAANFGKAVDFITVVPDNDFGIAALSPLKINDVGVGNILHKGERLGIYFLENGAVNRASKVIYDRTHSAFSEIKREWFNWEELLEGSDWFHWSGITPAISEGAAQVCLDAVNTAKRLGLTISADLNYRGNLWNYDVNPGEVMKELVSKSNVLLAGEFASKQFFKIETSGNNLELAQKIQELFPELKKIAITNREEISASHNKWSAAMYNGTKLLNTTEYDIFPIVDRVGTGDSFIGALIYGLQNFDDQKALDFATAASCLNHTIRGDYNGVTKEEIFKLMEGDRSGRIRR